MGQIKRPSTALTKAAELLENSSWCKGVFRKGNKTFSYCATGALAEVTCGFALRGDAPVATPYLDLDIYSPQHPLFMEASGWLEEQVPEQSDEYGSWCADIVEYNDEIAKSKKQVLALFVKAAAAAKAAGR